MCRWVAYSGKPLALKELLFETEHSLIDQSLRSRMGVETTNGDGFGVGWYDDTAPEPALFRTIAPAWNDRNARELAGHVRSHLFLAHVRASTGSAVQWTNTHPFRHGRWLFVHNGLINAFHAVHRELALAIDPSLYPSVEGSTDSEVMFHLALTFGLDDDPLAALERMAGFVERVGREQGIEHPLQMSLGVSDGRRLFGVRYSTEGRSRSLFFTRDAAEVKQAFPDVARAQEFDDEDRAIVSEPLGNRIPDLWQPVPEATALVVQPGPDEVHPFTPRDP
jgi:predicted glutamine amidotransferase